MRLVAQPGGVLQIRLHCISVGWRRGSACQESTHLVFAEAHTGGGGGGIYDCTKWTGVAPGAVASLPTCIPRADSPSCAAGSRSGAQLGHVLPATLQVGRKWWRG